MKRFFFVLCAVILFPALSTLSEAQVKPGWPKGVTIGTSGIGGVYFVWGGGFSKLLNDKMGIPASVEVTGGPVANIQLLEQKQLTFGLTTSAPLYEGWNGLGWAKGKKYQEARAIFPMFTTYFHGYATQKSGIKSVEDLKGKSVGVGAVGTTPAVYWPLIFEVMNVKPGRIVHAGWSDLTSQMKDGMLDSIVTASGIPWGSLTELEVIQDMNVFGLPKASGEKFIQKYPFFSPGAIPKGVYKANRDREVETVTVWNFMLVHKDAPDDFVYEAIKNTFAHVDILIAAHSSAKETKPEFIAYSPIPLHPAAVRYYQEKGIKLPDKK